MRRVLHHGYQSACAGFHPPPPRSPPICRDRCRRKAPAFVPGSATTGRASTSASTAVTHGAARTGAALPVTRSHPEAWSAPLSATTGRPWAVLVFGLEGDIDWTNIERHIYQRRLPDRLRNQKHLAWNGSRPRRLCLDRVMPYVTGGLAVGDIKANQLGFAEDHDTKAGWAAGAGIEAALAGNWTAKLEYLHVDLGNINCGRRCRAPAEPHRFPCRTKSCRCELPVLSNQPRYQGPGRKRRGVLRRAWNSRQ